MKKGAVIAQSDTVQIDMRKVRIHCWVGLSMEISRNRSTRILSAKSCSLVSTPGAEDFPKTGLEELRVSSHTPVADVTRETLQVEELVLVYCVSGGDRFMALEALLCDFQCTSLRNREDQCQDDFPSRRTHRATKASSDIIVAPSHARNLSNVPFQFFSRQNQMECKSFT